MRYPKDLKELIDEFYSNSNSGKKIKLKDQKCMRGKKTCKFMIIEDNKKECRRGWCGIVK